MFLKLSFILYHIHMVLSLTDQDIHVRSSGVNVYNTIVDNVGQNKVTPEQEKDPKFWYDLSKKQLQERLSIKPNYNRAKNVIIFLGDGMSLSTITAARIRKGQLKGNTGEEEKLFFENFPWTGLSKVN